MFAAVVDNWGATPVYREVPDPTPSDSAQVAVVEAAALTNLSRLLVSGTHYASHEIRLPAIPGVDGVARLADGRRVFTDVIAPHGLMAQLTLVDPANVVEIPEHVDSVTAAAIPNPGISAWLSLSYAAEIKPGDHVLILGATGVTGSTAAQLAKAEFGAGRVVVAGRDSARLDWLRGAGADDAISLRHDDWTDAVRAQHAERPFDAVLDYLWAEPAAQTLTALASSHPAAHFHATRFVQIGSMAGPTLPLEAGVLRGTGITLHGIGIGSVPPDVVATAKADALPRLFSLVVSGALGLGVQARPLSEVSAVWTAKEPSGTRVVLTP